MGSLLNSVDFQWGPNTECLHNTIMSLHKNYKIIKIEIIK